MSKQNASFRLGGPLFKDSTNPEQWIEAVKASGYRASFCPVGTETPEDEIKEYVDAAAKADITIAEVGAWSQRMDESGRPLRSVKIQPTSPEA